MAIQKGAALIKMKDINTNNSSRIKAGNDDDSASIQELHTGSTDRESLSSESMDSSTIDYRQAFATVFGACFGVGLSDLEEKIVKKTNEENREKIWNELLDGVEDQMIDHLGEHWLAHDDDESRHPNKDKLAKKIKKSPVHNRGRSRTIRESAYPASPVGDRSELYFAA